MEFKGEELDKVLESLDRLINLIISKDINYSYGIDYYFGAMNNNQFISEMNEVFSSYSLRYLDKIKDIESNLSSEKTITPHPARGIASRHKVMVSKNPRRVIRIYLSAGKFGK